VIFAISRRPPYFSGEFPSTPPRLFWSLKFDEPIALPDGGKLVLLRDAAHYITALPAKVAARPEWQATE